jgi:hypothetical protein
MVETLKEESRFSIKTSQSWYNHNKMNKELM